MLKGSTLNGSLSSNYSKSVHNQRHDLEECRRLEHTTLVWRMLLRLVGKILDESEDEDIAHYNASLFRPMEPW